MTTIIYLGFFLYGLTRFAKWAKRFEQRHPEFFTEENDN